MDASPQPTKTHDRKVDQLISHYGLSHTHPTNELIHYIAIPAIVLSLCGMLYSAHPWAAFAFIGASLVYYATLSGLFFVIMSLWSVLTVAIVMSLGSQVLVVSVITFVVAWIFQFIGHKIEGKKPSFLEDIQYLWVGPLFVISRLMLKMGMRW